jgi:hypothetical protein
MSTEQQALVRAVAQESPVLAEKELICRYFNQHKDDSGRCQASGRMKRN